ncbi:MAG TPA: hypothetical protein DGN60_01990 [Chloroflexi bacterium]|nr:hypothetical protein [Chloroflexota bacterium]
MTQKHKEIDNTILSELLKHPTKLIEEFESALEIISTTKDLNELNVWANLGLSLANQTSRSWETAASYFYSSSQIANLIPHTYFVKWSHCGANLCKKSPQLATSYFQASPNVMTKLRSRHIETWANFGHTLYKETWKSGTLASKFFDSSPELISSLSMMEMETFVNFLDAISLKSIDTAIDCLDHCKKVFTSLDKNKTAILSISSILLETNWKEVPSFLKISSEMLPEIHALQRPRFLDIISCFQESENSSNIPSTTLQLSKSLSLIDQSIQGQIIGLAEQLLTISTEATSEFVLTAPNNLQRIDIGQIERWHKEGLNILLKNIDAGVSFFRVESSHSQQVIESLSSSVEFEKVKHLIEMYCQALAGSEIQIAPSEDLVDKNIGWISNESPSTEGSIVYLPSLIDRYNHKIDNFAWLKVVSTHQVGHLEFGSFGFKFERPSTIFSDLRCELENRYSESSMLKNSEKYVPATLISNPHSVTDMQRFFRLFDDKQLALDIFSVVEDYRIDSIIKKNYLGLKQSYNTIQTDSISTRPKIKSLPAREALVEFLVLLSLKQNTVIPVPSKYSKVAKNMSLILRNFRTIGALVEDSAEATLRIYSMLSQVPNEDLSDDEWQDLDSNSESQEDIDQPKDEDVLRDIIKSQAKKQEENNADENQYESVQNVDYRGDFKPELVQLLSALRNENESEKNDQNQVEITQEMIEELLKESADVNNVENSRSTSSSSQFASNILKEASSRLDTDQLSGKVDNLHVEEKGGALDPSEHQSFVYDEWDFRAGDYKPRWCIIKHKNMEEGNPEYYSATLHDYRALVGQIRRQFELMAPETLRKVRKLVDGEDIDIDDAIEAMIDIKTGSGPSEKLYWRRNKVQRDVAVIFLLDTSASTAEAIEETRNPDDKWEAPNDQTEYMAWLRARRGEGTRRSYKRIIDLEKEAVVLLINALETIGDVYGIYAFSGYGRENVEFYTIKDIEEAFSDTVKRRIDRVAPMHATRMGPAIRHATTKLESQDARTKILFLISDGRPQDRGYSREGVEKEYAVHDTKKALDEARDKDITAFCLTVDKNGHDYLKTMCEDIGYEVLDDINTLPRRMLYLYRRLTT